MNFIPFGGKPEDPIAQARPFLVFLGLGKLKNLSW
jgi:hypothetical protein